MGGMTGSAARLGAHEEMSVLRRVDPGRGDRLPMVRARALPLRASHEAYDGDGLPNFHDAWWRPHGGRAIHQLGERAVRGQLEPLLTLRR